MEKIQNGTEEPRSCFYTGEARIDIKTRQSSVVVRTEDLPVSKGVEKLNKLMITVDGDTAVFSITSVSHISVEEAALKIKGSVVMWMASIVENLIPAKAEHKSIGEE